MPKEIIVNSPPADATSYYTILPKIVRTLFLPALLLTNVYYTPGQTGQLGRRNINLHSD